MNPYDFNINNIANYLAIVRTSAYRSVGKHRASCGPHCPWSNYMERSASNGSSRSSGEPERDQGTRHDRERSTRARAKEEKTLERV